MTEGPRLSPWALKNFNRFVPSLPPVSCFLSPSFSPSRFRFHSR